MRVEWNKVIRYLAYTLELLVLFMLQETPGLLPPLFGARPVLLFLAVITIAMFETEIPALAFGVVGGLFCDFGLSGTLGFHALVLVCFAFLSACWCGCTCRATSPRPFSRGLWASA